MTPFLNPTFIISILIALSIHEWAHGYVAYLLGDPTAKESGRLTINPIAHLDLLGTILFLTIGFGWGKPVPIDPRYFQHPKRDTALVAIAGPVSNLILATAAYIALTIIGARIGGDVFDLLSMGAGSSVGTLFLVNLFASSLFINLGLMAFNLIPIAPLDGSRVLHAFIPLRHEDRYEDLMRHGPMLLLILLLAERFLNFPFLSLWISGIMNFVLSFMQRIVALF
ncbi:site-2 protease family protein [Candidatus Peregrinibacteria bacterium]|nr:site-2 protease family protein [Candidatus Peregrinibacteria bacterium]